MASPVAFTRYAELGPELVVEWNGDGTYTPRCELCGRVGKARAVHSHAVQALRKHGQTALHRDLLSGKEMTNG